MAITKSYGYTDTPVEGVTSLTFPRAILNFGTDFRVKSEKSGKELTLTNITSPIDRPEKIRVAYSEIPNIYNGSGISASVSAPTTRGVSILAQVTDVISITDPTDPDYRIDLPVSYHVVIKVPVSDMLSAADIEIGLGRLISSLYDTGSTSGTRLEALLRGSLAPAGV
jgi:hypothetical protein